jgi:DNA-binding winged helix-turn-helix (wHTH) protein/Tol biopolymer transport system component
MDNLAGTVVAPPGVPIVPRKLARSIAMAAQDAGSSPRIRFGLYEVDLAAHELRRDGVAVRLQERPFAVLAILVERPGEVISRDEFRQRLWPADTFVDFDASLNTSINKLRQALSDNAENPRFIATAGRRGYRFIAPATAVSNSDAPSPPHPPSAISPPRRASKARPRAWAALALAAIGVIALVVIATLRPEPLPKVTSLAQITNEGLLDPWGKITTDGARLFYLDRTGSHWTLMQVPASGGEAQTFSEPSENIRVVDVAPDRSELLSFAFFGRSKDLPMSLTPVVGGPPRRVGNIVADDAVFSPNGRRIFYTGPDGIYSCALDGSQVQKLIALPDRSSDPQWSRDGARLRFTLGNAEESASSIWEVAANGSHLHAVNLHLPQPGSSCCGRWSTDGRYFFFTVFHEGLHTLWAIRDRPRWLSASATSVELTFGPAHYGGLITTDDPTRAFVWSGSEQREMARYSPASGRVLPLLPVVGAHAGSLSPDGTRLAYAAGGELWRSATDGSSRQHLGSGFAPIARIAWSPDAKWILLRTIDAANLEKFFVVSADGGPATELSMGSGHNEPFWSADSGTIVFARWAEGALTRAQSGIFLLHLQSFQVTKIAGSEDLIHPSFSPDGRFLAAITNFDSNPNQPTRVMLLDTRKHDWTEIARGTLVNPVQWSKDSRTFYYQDILADGQPAFRYATATNKSEPFVDFASLLRAGYVRCSLLSFAPDGALVVSLVRNQVNIYRLELDLP